MNNRACFKRAGGAVPMHFKLSGDLNSRMLAVMQGSLQTKADFVRTAIEKEVLRLEDAADRTSAS